MAYASRDDSYRLIGSKLITLAIFTFFADVTLSACTQSYSPIPRANVSTFRLALPAPSPVSDAGWNAAAFDGLQLIKKDLGAETAPVQTI